MLDWLSLANILLFSVGFNTIGLRAHSHVRTKQVNTDPPHLDKLGYGWMSCDACHNILLPYPARTLERQCTVFFGAVWPTCRDSIHPLANLKDLE